MPARCRICAASISEEDRRDGARRCADCRAGRTAQFSGRAELAREARAHELKARAAALLDGCLAKVRSAGALSPAGERMVMYAIAAMNVHTSVAERLGAARSRRRRSNFPDRGEDAKSRMIRGRQAARLQSFWNRSRGT